MATYDYSTSASSQVTKTNAAVLSKFMSQVYRWMMVGILITAVVAHYISINQPLMQMIFANKLVFFGLVILQLAAVIGLSAGINRMNSIAATTIYLAYSALTGVTLSIVLLAYTQSSVSSAFLVTAIAFGGLSAFGYFTKANLGPVGTFCTMALFGLIGMFVLSIFFKSMQGNGMQMALSFFGLLIFSGLTAYDTQRIKQLAFSMDGTSDTSKKFAVHGALMLYLDFINLFLSILRLMGDRR
jgi:FtsH-binding integral membrane protein